MVHQDRDAVEPAHIALGTQIERELTAAGVPLACAVTPAWEFESWWYLWPDAIASVNARWRRLNRTGQEVAFVDAKEALRDELRPRAKDKPTADYSESDGLGLLPLSVNECILIPQKRSQHHSSHLEGGGWRQRLILKLKRHRYAQGTYIEPKPI